MATNQELQNLQNTIHKYEQKLREVQLQEKENTLDYYPQESSLYTSDKIREYEQKLREIKIRRDRIITISSWSGSRAGQLSSPVFPFWFFSWEFLTGGLLYTNRIRGGYVYTLSEYIVVNICTLVCHLVYMRPVLANPFGLLNMCTVSGCVV